MPSPEIHRVVMLATFAAWGELISRHAVTVDGLLIIRRRLRWGGEFIPGAELDRMVIDVEDAIAAALGVPPCELPGSPLAVEDTPAGLDDTDGPGLP